MSDNYDENTDVEKDVVSNTENDTTKDIAEDIAKKLEQDMVEKENLTEKMNDIFDNKMNNGNLPEASAEFGSHINEEKQGEFSSAFASADAGKEGYKYTQSEGWQRTEGGKTKKKMEGWKIALIVIGSVLIFTISMIALANANTPKKPRPSGTAATTSHYGEYIAKIYIEGTITSGSESDMFGNYSTYNHFWTLEELDALIEDEDNKGLLLYINTPGGGVYESDELYYKIKEYQKETKNPVMVYMGPMAASGGYYIAAPADYIYANRNTWTGSIGVTLGTMYDISQLLDTYGIKSTTVASGANKAMGSSVEPMTAETRAIFQSLVDEAYEQFVTIISTERKIELSKVKALGDGRIYTAKQAKNLSLIDAIGTEEEAEAYMKKEYDLKDVEIIDVIYEYEGSWMDSFVSSGLKDGINAIKSFGQGELGAALTLTKGDGIGPLRYMYEQ